MLMLRDSAARTWSFYWKTPSQEMYTASTSTLADTAISAYAGWTPVSDAVVRHCRPRRHPILLAPASFAG
jgi:hypothetical protein